MSSHPIFHERQSLQLCALHVLNNLLQEQVFSKSDLDSICLELAPGSFSWWNPHRSPVGLGNYDVNIIMAALQRIGLDTIWFDKRRDIRSSLRPEVPVGYILNVPSAWKISRIFPDSFRPKHWIAIKRIDQSYYNLDSNLAAPKLIGEASDFLTFMHGQLEHGDGRELIVVVDPKVTSDNQLWI